MFLPLIIAILMGLVTPTTNTTSANSDTVYVNNSEPNGDDGINGPGGTGTSGGTGQNPPPPPPNP